MANISSEGIQAFQDYKLRGAGTYLIYQLANNGQIEVTTKGTEQKEWDAFVYELPSDKACWAVKSFHYETKEGGKRSKCLLIQWIPSNANKKDKMTYAMWSNNVKMSLQGIHSVIQANSVEDLDKEVVLQKVSKFERDEM